MKFGKKYSKITVLMAVIHGVAIGLVAILLAIFIFIINGDVNGVTKPKEELPTFLQNQQSGKAQIPQQHETIKLFAKQHGVFTNLQAAETFKSKDSSLSSSSILKIHDQYYIWSQIESSREALDKHLTKETFKKPFTIQMTQCSENPHRTLHSVFNTGDLTKIIKSVQQISESERGAIENELIMMTSHTKDLSKIRQHFLEKYGQTNTCLKIEL